MEGPPLQQGHVKRGSVKQIRSNIVTGIYAYTRRNIVATWSYSVVPDMQIEVYPKT